MFSKMNSNVRSVLKNIECSKKVQRSVALLVSFLGTAHGAIERDIAGFFPTVIIKRGYSQVSSPEFLGTPESNPLVLRPGVHSQVLTGSYWRQYAGFRTERCGPNANNFNMLDGVVPNQWDVANGVTVTTAAHLIESIQNCRYYCNVTGKAEKCNNPKNDSDACWLDAESEDEEQRNALQALKDQWIAFLERMCIRCDSANVHILIIREMIKEGQVYKATWGCALFADQMRNWNTRQEKIAELGSPEAVDEELPMYRLDYCISPKLAEDESTYCMIDVGTGKITVINAVTGEVYGQVEYVDNAEYFGAKFANPKQRKKYDVWRESDDKFYEIMDRVLGLLQDNTRIAQVRALPVRCTGSVRSGNNIERARQVFGKMGYQQPSLVSMQDEACFCAAQSQFMTHEFFVRYSINTGTIFDFNNGNECGKGSTEGGIQVFDYTLCLRAALELQSFAELEKDEPLLQVVNLFHLEDAFKTYFSIEDDREQYREDVLNALKEIHPELMENLLGDAELVEDEDEPLIPFWDDDAPVLAWNGEEVFANFREQITSVGSRRRRLIKTTYRKQPTMTGLMDLIENQRRH